MDAVVELFQDGSGTKNHRAGGRYDSGEVSEGIVLQGLVDPQVQSV